MEERGHQKLTTIRMYWASSGTGSTTCTRRLARRLRVGEGFDGVGFAAPVEGGAPGYGVAASASGDIVVVVAELDAVFTAGDGAPGVVLDFVRTGGDGVVLLAGLGGDGAAEVKEWDG